MRFTTKLKPKSVAAQQALANGLVLDLTQGGQTNITPTSRPIADESRVHLLVSFNLSVA